MAILLAPAGGIIAFVESGEKENTHCPITFSAVDRVADPILFFVLLFPVTLVESAKNLSDRKSQAC